MGGGSAGAQTRVLSCVNLQPNSPAQQGTYADDKGSILEKDKPVVKQKIQPLAQISHRFPEPTAGHYVVAGFSPRSHNETRDTLS